MLDLRKKLAAELHRKELRINLTWVPLVSLVLDFYNSETAFKKQKQSIIMLKSFELLICSFQYYGGQLHSVQVYFCENSLFFCSQFLPTLLQLRIKKSGWDGTR